MILWNAKVYCLICYTWNFRQISRHKWQNRNYSSSQWCWICFCFPTADCKLLTEAYCVSCGSPEAPCTSFILSARDLTRKVSTLSTPDTVSGLPILSGLFLSDNQMAMAFCGKNRGNSIPGYGRTCFCQKSSIISPNFTERDVSLEIDTSWLVFEILYDIWRATHGS